MGDAAVMERWAVESLNVGVATGILLHHLISSRQDSSPSALGSATLGAGSAAAAESAVSAVDDDEAADANKEDVRTLSDLLAAIALDEDEGGVTSEEGDDDAKKSIGTSPVLGGGSPLILDS